MQGVYCEIHQTLQPECLLCKYQDGKGINGQFAKTAHLPWEIRVIKWEVIAKEQHKRLVEKRGRNA